MTDCLSLSLSTMPNKKGKRNGKAANVKESGKMWLACRDNDVRKVQAAIAAGADVNYSRDEASCLMIAVCRGCNKIAELLLAAGADKEASNSTGSTALLCAAQENHYKCVELLLTAGAEKEAKTIRGDTALIFACQDGHAKCAEVLLKAGADPNVTNEQGTALMAAAANGHVKCIELLLTAGAARETTTVRGDTALVFASQAGHDKCIKLLLSAGCNVNDFATDGNSALRQAVIFNHIECVRTLVRAGADVSIQFRGRSLYDIVDLANVTINKDAIKVALRLPTSAAAASGEVCALCATTLSATKRLRCGRCLAVCYCSQACQRRDWKGDHKQTCKAPSVVASTPAAAAEDDKSKQNEQTRDVPVAAAAVAKKKQKEYRCAQCDTTMKKIQSQKCSVCRTTSYCSRECQVAHWQVHKPACKAKPVE
jgi:ankyrin repeat protein